MDISLEELQRIEIRALQDEHPKAHAALLNWGAYSRDRDDRPAWVTSPSWTHDVHVNKWEFDDTNYAPATRIEYAHPPERGDRREPEPYDEKAAVELCERMHGPGGLPDYLRSVVKVAYYKQPVNVADWHVLTNPPTTPSGFRERLAECLAFVGRWV